MCGITGFINFDGHRRNEARQRIQRMADTLNHRGPDEEGYYIDDFAALGHRRLSIIDLSSGQQPMGALEGQVQIVFNGEIYNFLEIRTELETKGYRFKTLSDTEVILLGYLEWGERVVPKLNGMFAFGIWDLRVKRLFLARDRVGKKPLYYFYQNGVFAFASEIKSLHAGGFCTRDLDLQALDCYFSFGYIPSPMSVYQAVRKLRPAHTLLVNPNGIRESRYWQLSFADKKNVSMEEAVDEFESLFDDAVRCRLMSEVPIGVFLSGGIDSPLVAASMARATEKPILTNSIGFDDKEFDELPLSRAVAKHLKTDHREFVVSPQAAEVLEKIAWHFDEPFADSSAIPTWYVCQMARKNVTVALSGDGGDETFAGYSFRYNPHVVESRIRSALPFSLRSVVFGVLGSIYPASARLPKPLRLKTFLENLSVSDSEAFYRDLIWLRGDLRQQLYSTEFMHSLKGYTPIDEVRSLYNGCDGNSPLDRGQFTDICFYMTEDVLVKVDRMSMAHSLEVRSPLLDYRIIEFAARLPASLKIKGSKGKLILRKAADRRLPSDILYRPKRGFSIPAAQWLRQELKPLVEQTVKSKNSLVDHFFNREKLLQIMDQHNCGARDHSVFLWGLMMFGLWEKTYK
jgi:asparagine synthase (glutamine-hydrolysing)